MRNTKPVKLVFPHQTLKFDVPMELIEQFSGEDKDAYKRAILLEFMKLSEHHRLQCDVEQWA